MYNTLDLNVEQLRFKHAEMRDMATKLYQDEHSIGSPALAALGRRLVGLGEKLQHSAQLPEQPAFELQTK